MSQPITTSIQSRRHRTASFYGSVLIVLVSLLLIRPPHGHADNLPNLLTSPSRDAFQSPSSLDPQRDPTVVRHRYVGLNLDVLIQPDENSAATHGVGKPSEHLLRLQLFDNVDFNVVLAQTTKSIDRDIITWSGFIDGMADSQVIIVRYGDVVAGNITTSNGGVYQIRYAGNRYHVVREMDLRAFPAAHPAAGLPEKDLINAAPTRRYDVSNAPPSHEDSDSAIDVMVLYTPAARSAVGGTSAIHALIELAVAEANEGYANSDVTQRLRLVHTEEVAYTEPKNSTFTKALQALTLDSDGQMDEIHALRDTHGADLVSLVIDDRNYCGLGWQNNKPSPSDERWAFSVVMHACIAGNYSLAHELGHNMGAKHDRLNANDSGLPYAYGYQDSSEDFRTIMAYNCDSWCPRINHWSNPRVTVNGKPTGVDQSDLDAADNHLALDKTYKTVARWRTKSTTTTPTTTDIKVTASGHQEGNGPDNTLDGDLNTRWSVALKPVSITYKLPKVAQVEQVEIAWFKGADRSATFEIAVSHNNRNWKVVYKGQSGGRSDNLEAYPLKRSSAQYVQIRGYGNTSNNNFMWTSITEVVIRDNRNENLDVEDVRATTSQAGTRARYTIDGDLQTRWSAALPPAWAIYDLSSVQQIQQVQIAWFKGNGRTNGFEIAVSTNRQNWQRVYKGRSSGNTENLEAYTFTRKDARYVRILGYGNSSQKSFMWNSITEVTICQAGGC